MLRALKGAERFEEVRHEYSGSTRRKQRKNRGDKSRLGNQHVRKCIKRARKKNFRGHADRYDWDPEYQANCIRGEIPRNLTLKEVRNDGTT